MLNMLSAQDSLITLQDGVLISLSKNFLLDKLLQHSKNLFVLQEDVLARGVLHYVSNHFKVINYSEFVILTEKHTQCMNW
ncbi:sulfurtransferase complex subunit TusB [Buchnera aphidicola]|uniref:sulfurtransferase complex subunit TusB n=1 Tax=Buchnera aphidicola TaxID=9 RepID=UPI003D18F7C0